MLMGGCAWAQPLSSSAEVVRYAVLDLPGAEPQTRVQALHRPVLAQPARYRVVVIPGSGCSGLSEVADRMFRGLLHGEVWVLHKPGVRIDAGPAPTQCPPGFVEHDDLVQWRADAEAALRALPLDDASLPIVIVGVSEGGELLPFLVGALPRVDAAVLIGASGLDPVEAGARQASRLGEREEWQALERAQASDLPDEQLHDGRTLRYWRGLWQWRSEAPLLALPVPLLQAWGSADRLVPPQAYERFAQLARQRPAGAFCAMKLAGADHGLQSAQADGLQKVWRVLEQWGRQGGQGLCEAWARVDG